MQAFTGTWRLVRLAVRRDRIKLPVILVVMSFLFYSSAQAAIDFYGKTFADQVSYAATNAPSVVARIFSGPVGGPSMGSIVLNETYLFIAIAIAFVSTMTVVRHTRQNEEFGRSELIESGVVSRHASLIAAMIVAVLLNLIFGLAVYGSLISVGLPSDGALGTGVAMAATGITFAAIAAVAAQLADSARGANSFSAIAIGFAFLLRAIGDGMGTLSPDGLSVQSAFPSWLSPLAWGQIIYPFTDKNWWIFGLYDALFVVSLGTAIIFMSKRDIGMGMITTRPGRARALPQLLSPFGLARRLQRGTLKGWSVAITLLGASFGFVIKDFEDFMQENEQFREAFSQSGIHGSFRDLFLSVVISMLSILIAGYAIQSLLRLRSEESGGQAEFILGASVGRREWQLSHISFTAFGVLLLTTLSSVSISASYILSTGSSWSQFWPILVAALTYSTAIFALAGFVIALIAFVPNLAVAAAWASFAGCLLIVQLGVILKLPQWVLNLSPFGHIPALPAQDFKLAPVVGLIAAALLLTLAGLTYFSRRDIITT
jgi:ABC-2 type transport system permease protein